MFRFKKAYNCTCNHFWSKNDKANFVGRNIVYDKNGFARFDVYRNNSYYGEFKLSVPGLHNVYNALACISMCANYGIAKQVIKTALLKFGGANRRFEYIGSCGNMDVYDDYAHHPSEISATAKAMKTRLIVNLGLFFSHIHIAELKNY